MKTPAVDDNFMSQALLEAKKAVTPGEVPVGAVLVNEKGTILARGHNQTISRCDPTAHAEIVVLRQAALRAGNHRLINTTLYVTLEPCVMCVGALIQARIGRLVFGAYDSKAGAVMSRFHLLESGLNHTVLWQGGILASLSAELLTEFFRLRR